jgi:hypothetical protein
MNFSTELEDFKLKQKLNIPEHIFLKMKWNLSNELIDKRSYLFKMLQNENIFVNFDKIYSISDLKMCTFYKDLIIYKDKNKQLFEFIFGSIFR